MKRFDSMLLKVFLCGLPVVAVLAFFLTFTARESLTMTPTT